MIFKKYEYKEKIEYTIKIKALIIITLILQIFTISIFYFNIIYFLIAIIFVYILTAYYILISYMILYPIDFILKKYIVYKAKRKISKIKDIKIIAITGSYGKTSTTNFIKTLLEKDYIVFSPGKSINTLLGISKKINDNLKNNTQILILEVGAYKRGEIREVMKNYPADISIITSIGTQHLERFKSITNIIKAGEEIIDYAKKDSIVIALKEIYDYPFSKYGVEIKFDKNKKYIKVEYDIKNFENKKTYFSINKNTYYTDLLGYAMIGNLSLAITCAEIFEIRNIQGKINLIEPSERRMYPILEEGILYIDDTYNIGEESAKKTLEYLNDMKIKNIYKRIFLVTGGIVERGKESESVNEKYGTLIESVVEKVFIFDTPYKKYIKYGIKNKSKIIEIKNYKEFEGYKKIFIKGDCILMQNEITDQYYFKNNN